MMVVMVMMKMIQMIAQSGCSALTMRLGAGGGWGIWPWRGLGAVVLLPWAPTCTPLEVRVTTWRNLDA